MRTDMGFFMRIGIVAPSTPILPDDAEAARAVVSLGYPGVELEFDPQCFAIAGHFAREDAQRLAALVAMANRADIDAIWLDRKSVVSGKSVSVRVSLGGRRIIKKKTKSKYLRPQRENET